MSEEMRKVTREATAYHEAGHVVALIVQGLTFTSATIKPDEDTNSNGASRHPPVYGYYYDGMRDRRAMARKMAVASCAGYPAELLANPRADEALSEEDYDSVVDLIRDHGIGPRGGFIGDDATWAWIERLKREARKLVLANRQKVERVALLLLERETISMQDVEE